MASDNLNIAEVVASQIQKEVTINDAINTLDRAGNSSLNITITGNRTLTAAEYTKNLVFNLTGAPGASFELIIPTSKRLFAVRNQTGQDCDVKYAAGSPVTVVSGSSILFHSDGSAIVSLGGGEGGGGGLGDAPLDGVAYVRRDGAWEPESPAGIDLRARMGSTRFVVKGIKNDPDDFTATENINAVQNGAMYTWLPTPLGGQTSISYFLIYHCNSLPVTDDEWVFILNNEINNAHYLTDLNINSNGSLTMYRDIDHSSVATSAAGVIAAGNTYDIIVTQSLTSGQPIKVYVNGAEVISTTRTASSSVDDEIGHYFGHLNEARFSRMAIWGGLLSAEQVADLHTYRNPMYHYETLGHYWPFTLVGTVSTPALVGGTALDVYDMDWTTISLPGEPVRAGNFILVGTAGVAEFDTRDNWLALATSPTEFTFIPPEIGWFVYDQKTGDEFQWNGEEWVAVAGGGGGGGAWGSITGTLADQTDLQTALNAKMANPMTTAGDLILGGASGAPGRLAKGSNGYQLRVTGGNVVWEPVRLAVPLFLGGLPPANALVLKVVITEAVTFPANFSGSVLQANAASTAEKVFDIRKNGSSVGSATVAAAGTSATFVSAGGAAVSFAAGDRLEITSPAVQDATLADISITLTGTRD